MPMQYVVSFRPNHVHRALPTEDGIPFVACSMRQLKIRDGFIHDVEGVKLLLRAIADQIYEE